MLPPLSSARHIVVVSVGTLATIVLSPSSSTCRRRHQHPCLDVVVPLLMVTCHMGWICFLASTVGLKIYKPIITGKLQTNFALISILGNKLSKLPILGCQHSKLLSLGTNMERSLRSFPFWRTGFWSSGHINGKFCKLPPKIGGLKLVPQNRNGSKVSFILVQFALFISQCLPIISKPYLTGHNLLGFHIYPNLDLYDPYWLCYVANLLSIVLACTTYIKSSLSTKFQFQKWSPMILQFHV